MQEKIKFSIKDFFSKVTFTEEILNGKLHILYSDTSTIPEILKRGCVFNET